MAGADMCGYTEGKQQQRLVVRIEFGCKKETHVVLRELVLQSR